MTTHPTTASLQPPRRTALRFVFDALLGLVALGLALRLWADFPTHTLLVAALAGGAFLLQAGLPQAWLLVLPPFIAGVDLMPWSGRLLFGEFDILLASLAAAAALRGQYRGALAATLTARNLVLLLTLAWFLWGIARGLEPRPPLDANAMAGYLSNWNALRVGRGTLWALVFLPLLFAQQRRDPAATERALLLGMTLGAVVFGGLVLWERGFFADMLNATNIYGYFASWLDLSTRHRVVGQFSQMHFGGSAVDGWVALLWPFTLALALTARQKLLRLLGMLGLLLIAYGCLMTFTRTTYAAVGLSGLVGLMVLLPSLPRGLRGIGGGGLLWLPLALLGARSLFGLGGVFALVALVAVIVGAGVIGFAGQRLGRSVPLLSARWLQALAVFGAIAVGTALVVYANGSSQWASAKPGLSLLLGALVLAYAGLPTWLAARRAAWELPTGTGLSVLMVPMLVLPVAALALGGTQMQERYSQTRVDFMGRLGHWSTIVSLPRNTQVERFVGSGAGSYPRLYLASPKNVAEGAWIFREGAVEVTGSSNLRVSQRVEDWVPGSCTVRLRYRVLDGKVKVGASLSPRPLLVQQWFGRYAMNFAPPRTAADGWQELTLPLDTSDLPRPRWYSARFNVFELRHEGGGAVEVSRFELVDSRGATLTRNSDFAQGGDHWFVYNDYEHLAWHAKNVPLYLWLEYGWPGLVLMTLSFLVAMLASVKRLGRGEFVALAPFTGLLAFLLLGLTTTLFDVPRLALLVWLVLGQATGALAGAAPAAPSPEASAGAARHRRRRRSRR